MSEGDGRAERRPGVVMPVIQEDFMVDIPPYRIEAVLHYTERTLVCRARHPEQEHSLILKMPANEAPTLEEINRIKHEYEVVGKQDIPGVIRVHGIHSHQGRPILLCEDIGGVSLADLLRKGSAGPGDMGEFLARARQIAWAVAAIHQRGIIHKDLKPANFIVCGDTGVLRITDFGSASLLHQEKPEASSPARLAGSLPYTSPEQTGRMNRSVDYRADLYSVGVCLYQMLTGTLPFEFDEPMAMIHAHIARAPAPPSAAAHVPRVLSNIVLKLLEKNAEDRYQSAYGLARDLERCLDQWSRTGQLSSFGLAQHDLVDRLQVSQKLYGREDEAERLLRAFDVMCQRGEASLLLVTGYSGIGKTSLVHELHKPIVARRGYFVVGKYDLLNRDIPYSALIQALRALIQQVLQEQASSTVAVADAVRDAMAGQGQSIVEVVPELEALIGPQPPVPELGPLESAHRFDRLFSRFITAVARREHPLTIFVDDLQWADAASLRLLRGLASSPAGTCLLLIGAYRDNEVDATHPLARTLREVAAAGGSYQTIALTPLRLRDVQALLADTLRREPKDVAPLAVRLADRTMGNPFFLRQLLLALYDRGLVKLDLQRGHWTWERERLDATHLAADVLELVKSKLETLEPATQEVLRRAACVGNTFSLSTLAVICSLPTAEIQGLVWPALMSGLVQPLGRARELTGHSPLGQEFDRTLDDPRVQAQAQQATYRFLHDQVQQAAYALISAKERGPVHLQVGRLLCQSAEPQDPFEVVHHLNIGASLITERAERIELARRNLAAALKARGSTAYQAAAHYADTGLEVLARGQQDDGWRRAEPALVLSLSMEQAECAFLCGEHRRAEALFAALLGWVDDEVTRCHIHAKVLTIMVSENRMEEALELGRDALAALGIEFNRDPTEEQWRAQDREYRALMGDRAIAALVDGPRIDDPRMEAALAILLGLSPPSYQTRPRRLHGFINVITMALNIGLQYGYASAAGYAYVTYAFCITNMDRYEDAYAYGRLGIALNERLGNAAMQGRVTTFFACFAQYWREHFRECEPYWAAAYHQLRETGDYVHANFMVLTRTFMRLAQGVELPQLHQEIEDDLAWIAPMGYELCLRIVRLERQLVANLRGQTHGPRSLDGDDFAEDEYLAWMRAQDENPMGMGYYYVALTMCRYLYGDPAGAIEAAEQYLRYEPGVSGMVVIAENGFYYPLAILAAYPEMSEADRETYWAVVERSEARAACWARNCPANFENRHLLIRAEMARVQGRIYEALELYDRAIDSAWRNEFPHNAALASELAARVYHQQGRARLARAYLEDARQAYLRWGATGKVAALDEQWRLWLPSASAGTVTSSDPTSTGSAHQLDLMSIVTASRVLSSEIVEDSLIEKIMVEIIKNAGASRGCLLLEGEHRELSVRAVGVIEGAKISVSQPDDPGDLDRVLCRRIVDDAVSRRRYLVIDDVIADERYRHERYVQEHKPRSVLCIPLHRKDRQLSLLYLENSLTPRAFTPSHVELLGLLGVQVVISLENASLYSDINGLNAELERLVEERTAELRAAQSELMDKAHKAGMAEVASETVHNVGNVLNSIMTSVEDLAQLNEYRSHRKLARVNELLEQHRDRLPELFAPGQRGELLLPYLGEVDKQLEAQSEQRSGELGRVMECITLIRDVIHAQQSYAGSSSLMEVIALPEMIDSLLVLQAASIERHGVRVERRFSEVAEVRVQKAKLMHVLLNLLKNAREAMTELDDRRITLTLEQRAETVYLKFEDTGVGVAPALREQIFRHGFTTKTKGRGLGLHSSINYMRQMRGDLELLGDEAGVGTAFMLSFPAAPRAEPRHGDR